MSSEAHTDGVTTRRLLNISEVAELLSAHNLPTKLEHADPDAVVMATARDKKRRGAGSVPFVLLDSPGNPRPGCPVEPRALVAAVRELSG